MPRRHLHLALDDRGVRAGLERIRREMDVPDDFPPQVRAEAERVAADPRLPAGDRTDLPLVTIDPEGSRDLDQAVHIAREGSGYRLTYAIADVAAFVRPGGAVDAEAHRRGMTLYAPDRRTPLHPPVLSEGAASLLPGQDRPALVWSLGLDAAGEVTAAEVTRALVRSRAQLTYDGVQQALDDGTAEEPLQLLREVGRLREQRERDRGGATLPLPEQEVVQRDGHFVVDFRGPLPTEAWNAQVSLLTGMVAADLMLGAGTGILRTLPDPEPAAVARLRRTARALGVPWPAGSTWTELVRDLDPAVPKQAALLTRSRQLLRGGGYRAFAGEPPADAGHAALAADYAHCTAPLRRLVDRYSGEVCLAVCAGEAVRGWVLDRLEGLPAEMAESGRRASGYERACVDLVEAAVLSDRIGEVFTGVVVDVGKDDRRGVVQVEGPDVVARVDGADLPLGEEVHVRLVRADVADAAVEFELVG